MLISGLGFAAPANATTQTVPIKDNQGFDTVRVDASTIRFEKGFNDAGSITYYLEIVNQAITNSDTNGPTCSSTDRCQVGGTAGYGLELTVDPSLTSVSANAIMLYTGVTGSTQPGNGTFGWYLNVAYFNALPALTPTLGTPTSTADGFTVNVTNYDADYTWTPTVNNGTVAPGTATGTTLPLTVTGLSAGASATITVKTSRSGYADGTATVTGTAQSAASPTGAISDNGDGTATVSWSNLGTRAIEICTAPSVCPYLVPTPLGTSGSVTITEGMQVLDFTTFPAGQVNLAAGSYDIFLLNTNTTTTVAQSQSAISIGGGGGGTSSGAAASAPVEVSLSLDLATSDASCTEGSAVTGFAGAWLTLPGDDECSSVTNPDANLLGWSTSANFPVELAQSQVDKGWGAIDDTFDGVRMIFIPAGQATFVSGPNSLHPIWAS